MSHHAATHTAHRFGGRRTGRGLAVDLPHSAFRLSIRARLWLGFGIVIAVTSIIVGLTTIQSSMLAATLQDLNTKDLPEVITLGHLHTDLLTERDMVRTLAKSPPQDPTADVSALLTAIAQSSTDRSAITRFEPPDPSQNRPNDTTLISDLTSTIHQIHIQSRAVIVLIQADQQRQALSVESTQLEPPAHHALADLRQLNALEEVEAAKTGAAAQADSQRATLLTFILAIVIIGSSISFAWILSRAITRPLSQLLLATETIAKGNLEVSTSMDRHDEFGRLGQAFETMRQHLGHTIATLARERRQTQMIIDASADGMLLTDRSGVVRQVNPACERLLGLTANDLTGKSIMTILQIPDQVFTADSPEQAASPADVLPDWQTQEFGNRWLAVSYATLRQDVELDIPQIIFGLHDITPMKTIERMQNDFIAMVSHELRAPLTTVSSSVELLNTLDNLRDGETFREVLGILTRQTHRLSQVIEEVLQSTRLEAGRLQVHCAALPILEQCQAWIAAVSLEWMGEHRALRLRSTTTAPEAVSETRQSNASILVWADRDLLEIVVRNVLENARKYSPEGSPITLAIQADEQAGRVILRIIDQGPGVPAEMREQIFERFMRASGTVTQGIRGFGLGLYISRALMRAMDGDIWVESATTGSIFHIAMRMVRTSIPIGQTTEEQCV